MKAPGRSLALGLALLLAAFSFGHAQTPAPPDTDHQILVMLKSAPAHVRPNTDYGGAYGDGAGRAARRRIAARLADEYGVRLVSEWPMPLLGVDCFVMTVPSDQSPDEVAARLSREPGVSWSEALHSYKGLGDPAAGNAVSHNDPLYRAQPAATEWRLAELHQIATGRNVRVAVIDSMIERTHPDLAGQIEHVENFVTGRSTAAEQHGTSVAGIIGARSDNGLGIAGVAPRSRILGLRACWQEPNNAATLCDSLSLAKALDYAITHRAQVINLSLSGPTDRLLGRLIDVALTRGAVVVAAYDRSQKGGGFPASHTGVTAVIDEADGPSIAGVVNAPGRGAPTTLLGARWGLVEGSSYAAAHVSGLFALLRERGQGRPTLVIARPGDTIDTCATLLQKSGPCDCLCAQPRARLATSSR